MMKMMTYSIYIFDESFIFFYIKTFFNDGY